MRNKQQLDNFRKLLELQVGTDLSEMSYFDLDNFADGMQSSFLNTMYEWELRIRLDTEKDISWNDISVSSEKPYQTLDYVKASCEELLKKYDRIEAVQIQAVSNPAIKVVIKKDEN